MFYVDICTKSGPGRLARSAKWHQRLGTAPAESVNLPDTGEWDSVAGL